jgi:hypothetical protein
LSDSVLGKEVNITGSSEIGDIYEDVARHLRMQELESPLKYLRISRSLVKRPVMTVPYGVTQHGMVSQLMDKCVHKVIPLQPERAKSPKTTSPKLRKGDTTPKEPILYLYEALPETPKELLRGEYLALKGQDIANLARVIIQVLSSTY